MHFANRACTQIIVIGGRTRMRGKQNDVAGLQEARTLRELCVQQNGIFLVLLWWGCLDPRLPLRFWVGHVRLKATIAKLLVPIEILSQMSDGLRPLPNSWSSCSTGKFICFLPGSEGSRGTSTESSRTSRSLSSDLAQVGLS